jgi:hypothetical protein
MMKRTTYYAASAGCGMGADDPTQPKTCNFASHTKSYEAEEVQKTLRMMGATGIKADGLWGACSESAYAKVFGEPLTKESLLKIFEINCAKLNKVFAGSKTCSDGSDAVDPNYTKAPPPSDGSDAVDPNYTKAPPPSGGSSSVRHTITAATPQVTKRWSVASMIKSPTYVPKTTDDNALSAGEQTLIPGVPNLYVTIGGLALLGVVGWYGYKAMSGGGKVKKNAGKKKPTKRPAKRRSKRRTTAATKPRGRESIWWVMSYRGKKKVAGSGPTNLSMATDYVAQLQEQQRMCGTRHVIEQHDNW